MCKWQTVSVCVVSLILLGSACGKKAALPAPLAVTPPPSQGVPAVSPQNPPGATPATAPLQASFEKPAASQPAPDQSPQAGEMRDLTPDQRVTVAVGMLQTLVDRFKEDYNRYPRSLAEIRATIPRGLPPGKTISYNPASGKVQVVGQ